MTIADINTLARFLTKTNTTSLSAANLLILVNNAYERIVGKLVSETVGSKWPFGDFNYTAFPSFTVTMSNSTAEYDMTDWGTTDEETILVILGVEVKDQDGIWHTLRRTSLREINEIEGLGQTEYFKTDGRPVEYELRDNFIILYPAPDNGVSVTLTAGLKIHHLRTSDRFTSAEVTTGTKEPGFPAPWHYLVAYGAAIEYAISSNLPNVNQMRNVFETGLKELLDFVIRRDQTEHYKFTTKGINFR